MLPKSLHRSDTISQQELPMLVGGGLMTLVFRYVKHTIGCTKRFAEHL